MASIRPSWRTRAWMAPMPPWAMPRSRSLISKWMLVAVNIGCSHPWTLNLSRRRSRRRLRCFNCRRILVFTRNPSLVVGNEKFATYQTPQKAGDFEIFAIYPAQQPLGYAFLRSRRPPGIGLHDHRDCVYRQRWPTDLQLHTYSIERRHLFLPRHQTS